MPWGLCRRKKKPKTLADTFGELLEEIDSEIRASEERLLKFRAGHTSVSRGLIFYGVAAYGLILASAYLFTPDPRIFWQKAARVGLVMGFPLVLWVVKKLVDVQYGRAIAKEQQRLAKLSKKRADTCADLESKTDWKKLAKLLGKGDAPPPQQRPPTTAGPFRPPGTGGGAVGPDMKTPGRPGHNTYVPPVQAYVPTARTRADKFVDYILGDGPNNRYALICAKCFTHNGLARVEEVSQVRYRCTMCQFLNGPPLPGGAAGAGGAAGTGAGAGAAVPPTPLKGAGAPGGPAAAPATPKSGAKDSGSDMDTADTAGGAAAGAGAGNGVPGSAVKAPNPQAQPPATPAHGAGGGGGMGAVPVVNGVPFVQMTPQAYRTMNPTQQQQYNAWFKEFKAHVSNTPKAGAGAAAAAAAAATPKPAPAGPAAATPARPPPAAGTDTPAPAQAPATKVMAAAGAPAATAAAAGAGAGSGKLSALAEAVGVAVAPMAFVDSRSFFVTGDTKQPKGEGAIAAVKAKNPNVLFAIARSKNLNIVVYEALLEPKQPTKLHAANAVDVYWLDLDASYAVEARKKGVPHDREDLNWVEKKMAYGATATERTGKGQAGTFDLALVAVPGRAIVLAIDPKANRPRAYISLKAGGKDVECVLERIFVHTIDGWTGPDVDWYEIVGTAVADGKEVVEKVVRK